MKCFLVLMFVFSVILFSPLQGTLLSKKTHTIKFSTKSNNLSMAVSGEYIPGPSGSIIKLGLLPDTKIKSILLDPMYIIIRRTGEDKKLLEGEVYLQTSRSEIVLDFKNLDEPVNVETDCGNKTVPPTFQQGITIPCTNSK
jgi:hypothetical protein